jgi:hypothetical protein
MKASEARQLTTDSLENSRGEFIEENKEILDFINKEIKIYAHMGQDEAITEIPASSPITHLKTYYEALEYTFSIVKTTDTTVQIHLGW